MNKIHNQLLVIVGLIMFFVCLNMGIYKLFTKRCISDYSDGLKAKSIELDRYLPFVEDSEVVKVDSELMLEGDLPVLGYPYIIAQSCILHKKKISLLFSNLVFL